MSGVCLCVCGGWGGAEGVEEGRMARDILISPLDLISKSSKYEIKI